MHLQELTESPLPYISPPDQAIGGILKERPEDFIVEEVPVYLPCGEGDHLFLWIEKRDLSAEQLQQHVAKSLKISHHDVGVAGLKDRRAVTRQWISVPATSESSVEALNRDDVQVLEAHRHTNKLKTGHLKGNRFTITVRDVRENASATALGIRDLLNVSGVPNYFGSQRFGRDSETLRTGYELLTGAMKSESIPRQRRKFLTRLSLSAVQSAIFNCLLAQRVEDGTVGTVHVGDVLQVVASGGPFVSDDPVTDQQRFNEHEIVTSGPLFGPKMKLPTGEMLEFETGFLKQFGLSIDHFSRFRKLTSGTRRALLFWLEDLDIAEFEKSLRFQFTLPTGVYATVILREFMKSEDRS